MTIFKRNKAINVRSDSLEKQSRWQSTRSIWNSFVNSIHLKSTMQKPSMNSIWEEPSRNGSMICTTFIYDLFHNIWLLLTLNMKSYHIVKPQKFKKLSSVARSISPLNNDLLVSSTSNNFDFSISPIKLRVSNLKEYLFFITTYFYFN